MGERISGDEFSVDDELEGVRGFELILEMGESGTEPVVGVFYLDEKPRLLVADDDEIDFALLFVAEVAEFEISEAEVVPAIGRLEQVAGDEGFGTFAGVVDAGPVAEEPLGFLAQGFVDVFKPRANEGAEVQGDEDIEPGLDGVWRDLQVAGQ